jgi:hypothetical protein
MPVTAVVRILVAVVIFRVTEFLVQLGIQPIFKDVADQLLEKFLNVYNRGYVQILQKRCHLGAAFTLFRGAFSLYHTKTS